MAESIEMPFELRTRVVPMNHVLDGVLQIPIGCGKFLGGGGRPIAKYVVYMDCRPYAVAMPPFVKLL